ncbi:MAG TPA: flagellar hook-associated protein FlgK [Geminicoccaceae bacterium]|nr:flagellar hook-associated protein FlgK [Geminicoccaceae bacterium]
MSLSTALSIAASGLGTYSRLSDIAANNIANADVEGFVRKEGSLVSVTRDGRGLGVSLGEILRSANPSLAREARRETGLGAFLDVQAEALRAYAVELGQPADGRSIADAITRLEQAFISLAETPESASLQREVVHAAKAVTAGLGDLSASVRRLREDAELQIEADVQIVNQSLGELKRVNDEIKLLAGTGRDVTALEDERDRLIDTIAERIPVREIRRAPNDVLLLTEQGVPLFDGTPAQVGFTRTAGVAAAAVYAPDGAPEPGSAGILSGLTIDGRDLAPGSGDAQALTSGRIAGLFAVRDELTVRMQKQIDQLASALIDRFQDPANDPSLAPGAPGLFTAGGAFHDRGEPAEIVGMADRIAVNIAVDPDQGGAAWRVRDGVGAAVPGSAGDAAQPFRFLAAFDDTLSYPADSGFAATLSLRATAAELVSGQQAARAEAEARAERQAGVAATLRDVRANATGVNVDNELQRMLLIEKSYAANANVVQTAARMLDELLTIV